MALHPPIPPHRSTDSAAGLRVNAKALIWNDPATQDEWLFLTCLPVVVLRVGRDEAKSERPGSALSTVIKLIFEGFAGRAYLTVFHASGAASD